MALRSLPGGRPPRAIITVAAGVGMLGYTLYLDYSWAPRAILDMPQGLTVVREAVSAAWWKPWTLVRPQIVRIAAVDAVGVMRNPAAPDLALAQLYMVDRHAPTGRASAPVDCAKGLMARTTDGLTLDAAGLPAAARWDTLDADDPIRAVVCVGG
jgi:hypothetical protein